MIDFIHRFRGILRLVPVIACGCGTSDDVRPLALTGDASGSTTVASVGQEIDITLGTIGPGQYDTPIVSAPCVHFLDMSFPATQNPGGPTQLFRFQSVSTGTATITIPHSTQPTPFSLTVTVK